MNFLDLVLLVPLLWGCYRGFSKGLVFELTTFVALFAGVYGALHFSGIAKPYLIAAWGEEPEHLPIIAFAVTFLVIILGIHLLGRLLDRLMKWVALGLINRLLGAIFGVLKIGLFMMALLVMVRTLDPGKGNVIPEKTQKGSFLLSHMDRMTKKVMRYDLGEEWSSGREAMDT